MRLHRDNIYCTFSDAAASYCTTAVLTVSVKH